MRRTAIFDLDGTLIDSAPAITSALNRLRVTRDLPELDVAMARRWISFGAPRLVGLGLGLKGNAHPDDIARFRSEYAKYPATPEHLYPGIANALTDLRRAGLVLGICTNKPQALSESVLAASGIAVHFTAIIGGDATASPKPDGAHLQHTLNAMGCAGLPFDFIGDSSIDADAAEEAGARFLWAAWGYADAVNLAPDSRTLLSPAALVPAILRTSSS